MVKSAKLDGFEGGLFRNSKRKAAWSIVYNDALPVRGRINFVLAHELGHYLRHRRDLDEFLCSQRDMIEWDREDQVREADANQFGSYLLMPINDFRRQLAGQKITLDGLAHCAERYGVSLTAAILKWLEFTVPSWSSSEMASSCGHGRASRHSGLAPTSARGMSYVLFPRCR